MSAEFTTILLAGQRSGVTNPLAEKYGVSHKCLVPIEGTPLIARMLNILTGHNDCRAIRIMIEDDGAAAIRPIVEYYRNQGHDVQMLANSENIAKSVMLGCEGQRAPYLITTADNVLLSHSSIDGVLAKMQAGAGAVAAIAREADVKNVHREAQRSFYKFRDGGYANCNLYALADEHALGATAIFREGGQFMKNPARLVRAFGLLNILMMKYKLVTLNQALRLASRRFGISIQAFIPADGTQAVDVDNERTYDVVEMVLKARQTTT